VGSNITPFCWYQSMAEVICRACASVRSITCVCTMTDCTDSRQHTPGATCFTLLRLDKRTSRFRHFEEFHILVFDGRCVNCEDICTGSAFDSIKLSFYPIAVSHDCNMLVTSCVSSFSHVRSTIVRVRPLRICALHQTLEQPASCNGFKNNT
jgi:hypothetical protein